MSTPVEEAQDPFDDHRSHSGEPFYMTEAPSRRNSHDDNNAALSPGSSRRNSGSGLNSGKRREKKKVGWSGADSGDPSNRVSWAGEPTEPVPARTLSPPAVRSPVASPDLSGHNTPTTGHSRQGSSHGQLPDDATASRSHLPELSPQQTRDLQQALGSALEVPRPRPAIRQTQSDRGSALGDDDVDGPDHDGQRSYRQRRLKDAHERAKKLETDERVHSRANSRNNSPERRGGKAGKRKQRRSNDYQLDDLPPKNQYGGASDSDDGVQMQSGPRAKYPTTAEAFDLVRKHTTRHTGLPGAETPPSPGTRSGYITPVEEQGAFEIYRPHPEEYRGGILGSLMKLYGRHPHDGGHSRSSSHQPFHGRNHSGDLSTGTTPNHSPPASGSSTPKTWFGTHKPRNHSSPSLAKLIGSSASLGSPGVSGLGEQVSQRLREQREEEKSRRAGLGKRALSGSALQAINRLGKPRIEDEIRITKHIAEYIARQKYLMKLCHALMLFGAPTHRLEEYMNMSARVLEIQAQFLYIPGSMIMSFDDPATHTTEVKLVRVTQGLDLGKLRDVHEIYKEVVHDRIYVDEATERLNDVLKKPAKHSRWLRIPVYGLAAVCVGPFAFEARLIDLPIAFMLGCILGFLQLVVAPRSDLYANVFEIAATVITSFLSRAFGSIPDGKGGRIFCFSALAQSSIALILPGYIVLCASLELQSRSIVAGSIRMVYAIIYSLFLGYGITIGAAIYGIMDSNAASATTCVNPMPEPYFFPFVPAFTLTLIYINQAKWKQAPVMLIIAFVGYLVNFYSSKRFAGNTQVANTLGALAIGVLANLYSRVGARIGNWCLDLWEDRMRHKWKAIKRRFGYGRPRRSAKALEEGSASETESLYVRQTRRVGYGLAAAAMLPAIFVQVPSGLAVSGSLVSGIASANQIAGSGTNGTTVVNSTSLSSGALNSVAFNVGYSVIQVAIGITVGLFLSAIVVYPFGKRRSGLFSF